MTASDTARSGSGHAVTSWSQEYYWQLDRRTPRPAGYRICRAYEVAGPVNVQALRAAWRAVLDRHDALRTSFLDVDGRPQPRVAARSSLRSVSFVDIGHVAPAGRAAHADQLCQRAADDPLDVAAGPLATLTVLRLDPATHRVVVVLHRAVADERSASLVLGELSARYARLVHAAQAAVPDEPAVPYADYAGWQRGQEAMPGAFRRLERWWAGAMRPLPVPLVLPVGRPAGGVAAGGGALAFDWGEELSTGLDRLCRARGATPLAVLLAATWSLLHRHGGGSRLSVAVPVALRPQPFADLVGPCENLLALAGEPAGPVPFGALVDHACRAARQAHGHRGYPFGRLVELAAPAQLCALMLAVEETGEALELAGTRVRRLEVGTDPSPSRLRLGFDRVRPTLAGRIAYRCAEFDRAAVAAVLDQLRRVLAAGLADPGTPLSELPLDDRCRRETVTAADRDGAVPAPGEAVHEAVHEAVARRAADSPPAAAVAAGAVAVSYADLDRRSAAVAARLGALGVANSAVVVRIASGPAQLVASLGALRAGGHIVWLGTAELGQRGRQILAGLRPACVLVDGDPAGDGLALWYRAELGGTVVDLGAEPESTVDGSVSPPPDLDRLAYLAYTSGSSGAPKGVKQTHRALAQFTSWLADTFDLGSGARVAQWVAPEHDPALCEVFATLAAGGTVCVVPPRLRAHPEKFVDWLAAERITFLQTVPSFARELLGVIRDTGAAGRLAALRWVVLMGEALSGELANGLRAALPGARLANIYGPTETVAATWCEVTEDIDGMVPIGRPIAGRQVLVLDDADRPCPTGVVGQIVIRSRYVTPGYLGRPDGDEAFRPVPGMPDSDGIRCYRTGDLGRRRPDGSLDFHGRRDLQVKLFGTRVEIGEVEAVLAEHPSVAECAVVPLVDRDAVVLRLVAYVVPRATSAGTQAADAAAWRAHLRLRFGASMTLVSFERLGGRLPRTGSGKVDRRRLPPPRAVRELPAPAAALSMAPLENHRRATVTEAME